MIRKIHSIHLYWFHACLIKLTCCLVQNKFKHLKGPLMSLKLEPLTQNGSNPSGHSCITPIYSFWHVSCMHHIVALCLVLIVLQCVLHGRFCLRGYSRVSNWRAVFHHHSARQATNHLIISIQSHVLSPALFYCIKTTQLKLLCAAVVEPISSAWPVIATVTRWNPLACVGVDWAYGCVVPTLLCLLCLESCQVWFIWVMG